MTTFRFLGGGDGDQGWLGEPFVAERVTAEWFPGQTLDGPAYLLKDVTGPHRGEFLAITSRLVASLEEQIRTRNLVCVVVYTLTGSGAGFIADDRHLNVICMAAAEVVRPSGPAIETDP